MTPSWSRSTACVSSSAPVRPSVAWILCVSSVPTALAVALASRTIVS